MQEARTRRPSPALVVSMLALVIALSGVAYAGTQLPINSVGTKQIQNGAVTSPKLHNGAVATAKLHNGAVTTAKIKNGTVTASKIADDAIGASALGTITERSATSAPIAAGASGSASVQCNAGEQVLSGGNDGVLAAGYDIVASRFQPPNGWSVFLFNDTAASHTVTVRAYCLQP
jgi:hypothetical protein